MADILQNLKSYWNRASGFLETYLIPKSIRNLLILYTLLSLPFFFYHERHLPIFYIIALSTISLLVGLCFTYISLYLIQKYWKETFDPILEGTTLLLLSFAFWLTEIFSFRAGFVFFIFLLTMGFFFRILQQRELARMLVAGCLVASNALVSFKALQGGEILASYLLFKNKYSFPEKDFNDWAKEETSYWSENLELGFDLPEGYFLYSPKDLGMEDKTGAGQLAAVISSSDHDPNRYPSIRIFYFPDYVRFQPEDAHKEFSEFLQMQIAKAEMEDVQEIMQKENITNVIASKFWTFYDTLRPRYAKVGYILLDNLHHDRLLLHITENLEKGENHEGGIQSILDSIRFRKSLNGNQ